MKKKIILIILILSGIYDLAKAQSGIAINASGVQPDSSAMLDVNSSNKGILIPRIALTGSNDTITISKPATSLLVYNTTTTGGLDHGFYYWDSNQWKEVGSSGSGGASRYIPVMGSIQSPATMSFPNAIIYCDTLNESGYSDWYMPSLPELYLLRTNITGYSTATDYLWTAAGGIIMRLSDGYMTSPPSWNANYSNVILNNCCLHYTRCVR